MQGLDSRFPETKQGAWNRTFKYVANILCSLLDNRRNNIKNERWDGGINYGFLARDRLKSLIECSYD